MQVERRAMLHAAAGAVWTEVRRVLAAGGVPCLPVKGIVTASWLYDVASERELSDVDVRIAARDRRRARALGLRAGWTLVQQSYAYRQLLFRVGGVDVDIECACGPPGFVALSIEDMLRRARVAEEPRLAWLGPIPEMYDHTILLVVNAVKDHLIRAASWALDDLRRVVRTPGFDTRALLARAESVRALGMVLLVARHLAPGHSVWSSIAQTVRARGWMARTFASTYEALVASRGPTWALRLASRAASDGVLRPASSLLRAAAYETERTFARRRA